MPVALELPWNEIKDQFCKGVSVETLASTFAVKPGTIYQRAIRKGWRSLPQKQRQQVEKATHRIIAERVEQLAPVIDTAVKDWTDKSKRVAGRLVEKVSCKVEEPANPGELLKLASALEKADLVGRKALGIDTDAQNISVSLNFGLQVISGSVSQNVSNGVVNTDPDTLDV
jgi:hypothetical protein